MITKKLRLFGLFALTLAGTLAFSSCSNDDNDDNSGEDNSAQAIILYSRTWVTSNITDQDSARVVLTDSIPNTFVGYSYFKSNGDFRIVNLNDSNKMYGQWEVYNKGKLRLNEYDSFNKVQTVSNRDILTLNDSVFVYRVHYDETDNNKYFDVKKIATN